ncbi:MAG: YcjX family protein [Geminicoccaceae bacterium]|nr:MAG: YcjX family protein [Geminicoccaceae bacterium]
MSASSSPWRCCSAGWPRDAMAVQDQTRAWLKRASDLLPAWRRIEQGFERFGEVVAGDRVRVAVTGLSRSGKTVFVTCMGHHLERGQGLPFLNAVADRRFMGAKVVTRLPRGVPAFPFRAHQAALAGEHPHWPAPSTDLSLLRMDLRFRPRSRLKRGLAEGRNLVVDIIDYPGEWLIDLPLLHQAYADWAAVTLARMQAPLYRLWMRPFLDALSSAPIEVLGRAYVHGLAACRDARLSLLQPGRALTPTALDVPLEAMVFCPVPPGHRFEAVFRERFQAYLERWVRPFKEHVVDSVDRQVVLVDVLESLNRGPDHFDDTRAALAMILEAFNYGRGAWWQRMLAPKVERLVFCATKADHVANSQHANLKLLLQDMVDDAARRVSLDAIPVETLAVASLRATDTVRTDHDGQRLSCVRGVLVESGQERIVFPGEVPPTMPRGDEWDDQRFDFRRFAPRRLDLGKPKEVNGAGHGHIRLDQVLEAVLGDRLT